MLRIPSGTVTFFFSDVDASCRSRLEQYPDCLSERERLDQLLSESIAQHGGYVFNTLGFQVCAAFASAVDAAQAAIAAQRAVLGEPWDTMANRLPAVRVRIALHTGEAVERDGDYYGSPLNRCHRLQELAHGGQILVSQATFALLRTNLPEGAIVRDLGEHRLRDLEQREHVCQLAHSDLPNRFPALRSLDSFPNNLPVRLTRYYGREAETERVEKQLQTASLVTIMGHGGLGKTRLALQVAANVLDNYQGGAWFIDLAALPTGSAVAQTVSETLGLHDEPHQGTENTLVEHLKGRRVLLILDNCEHVVENCAVLADQLLADCPDVRIVATSREALGVEGEVSIRLPALATPKDPDAPSHEVEQFAAVRLFVDRARAARSGFALTDANASTVAELCRRLDGIPLALELAAALIAMMSPDEVLARIDERFGLLTNGKRTAPQRHQTLRAALDWSYDMLDRPEKLLLQRLSVFSGGWKIEAAEVVAGGDDIPANETIDLLARLVGKSLLTTDDRGREVRFHMLDTVRQYGAEKLTESDLAGRVRDRHLQYYSTMANDAMVELVGPDQRLWLDRLDEEHANLISAMDWSIDSGTVETGLQMAAAIWRFWFVRGHFSEGRDQIRKLLAANYPHSSTEAVARALHASGTLAVCAGDTEEAEEHLTHSLRVWREIGDAAGEARALNNLANLAHEQGDYETARAYYENSLEI